MGLMDFIKKQFIDVIQWTEDDATTMAWRYPMADMEIQNGGSLTARESQKAVFVNEGKIADVFRHWAAVDSPVTRRLLERADAVADALGLDDELLDTLISGLKH